MADSAIRASYIHAVKRWGRGWSAGAGEGEWGCGVWEVLIHTRTRGGGQYATHEIEGKPASCVFTVQQTCNFGSCDERRHRQAWRFSRALCTRPRFRFGQDCPTQLSLSTVCPYLALFLFRNRRQLHQSTPLDVCEPCSAAGDIGREGDLSETGNWGHLACFRAQKKAKAIFASIQPDSTPAKYTRATETGEKICKPVATAEVAAASGSARRQPVLLLSSCMRRLPWVDFKDDPGQQSLANLGWEVGPCQ